MNEFKTAADHQTVDTPFRFDPKFFAADHLISVQVLCDLINVYSMTLQLWLNLQQMFQFIS